MWPYGFLYLPYCFVNFSVHFDNLVYDAQKNIEAHMKWTLFWLPQLHSP